MPDRPLITRDDLIDTLMQIEMLTATGEGLTTDEAMRAHLMAGIGRAAQDRDHDDATD